MDKPVIIRGPDGRTYRFPAGTTQESMMESLRRVSAGEPPVPPSPDGERIPGDSLFEEVVPPWYQRAGAAIRDTAVGTARQLADELTDPQTYYDALPMVGSTVGMAVGLPLGPAGVAGGSALGSGIGRSIQGAVRGEDVQQQVSGTLNEMAMDAGFSALGPGAAAAGRRVLGLAGEGSKQVVQAAERLGLDMGLMAATENRLIKKSWPTVIGVFPFTSGGMERNVRKGLTDAEERLYKYLDEVAPTTTLWNLGVDLTKAAEKQYSGFRREATKRYNMFFDRAKELNDPPVIPTDGIKDTVSQLRSERISPRIRVGEEGSEKVVRLNSPLDKEVTDFIYQLGRLDDNMSPLEWRTLQQDLNYHASRLKGAGLEDHRIGRVKQALEDSMAEIEHPELKGLIDDANRFFAQGSQRFETRTSKHFERVDRNIFENTRMEKAGSLTEDRLSEVILRQRSPQSVRELRQLVGPEEVQKVARANFDDLAHKSFRSLGDSSKEKAFSFTAFGERLKLDEPSQRAYLEELLKGSGVGLQQLEDLIKVGRAYEQIPLRDASTFVARRLTFAGLSAVALSNFSEMIMWIPMVAMANATGRVLTNPRAMSMVKGLMDDSVSAQNKRILAGRLVQYLREDWTPEDDYDIKDLDSLQQIIGQ